MGHLVIAEMATTCLKNVRAGFQACYRNSDPPLVLGNFRLLGGNTGKERKSLA